MYTRKLIYAIYEFSLLFLDNHHRNMNEMWSEMSDGQREEYKEYFIAYHNGVAKTGITGKRIKPITVLPENVINGFEKAMLTKVVKLPSISIFTY